MMISLMSDRPPVQVSWRVVAGGGRVAAVRHTRLPARNPQARWNEWAAALVVEGRGRYHDHRGHITDLQPGSLLQHLPGQHHRIVRDDPDHWTEFTLRADAVTAGHLQALGLIDPRPAIVQARGGLRPARAAFVRFVSQLDDPGSTASEVLHALHTCVLAWFPPRPPPADEPDPVMAMIGERLASDIAATWTLAHAAASVALSPAQFRRRFTARFGVGPNQWRERHRLSAAARLLVTDGLSVSSTATACGYSDPAVFSRAFKRRYGYPPNEHRTRSKV